MIIQKLEKHCYKSVSLQKLDREIILPVQLPFLETTSALHYEPYLTLPSAAQPTDTMKEI